MIRLGKMSDLDQILNLVEEAKRINERTRQRAMGRSVPTFRTF